MKCKVRYRSLMPIYILVILGMLLLAIGGSHAVTVLSVNAPLMDPKTVIIDAGHGGVDGGASSCTGVLESRINLEIALKLNDLLHLLGIHTTMIRDGDYSVYTQGSTIAQKKVSDLKERVRTVNSTKNPIVISIHQNFFSDSRYSGAQVFYAPTPGSQELASELQLRLKLLDPTNRRQIKKSDGIYFMQNILCPGILVECGFLSNPEEEALLRDTAYQAKICAVLASVCSNYLHA